jgi:hypothetical protein
MRMPDEKQPAQPSPPPTQQSEPYALCYQFGTAFYYYHAEHAPEDSEREARIVPLSKLASYTICFGCHKRIITEAPATDEQRERPIWGKRHPTNYEKKTRLRLSKGQSSTPEKKIIRYQVQTYSEEEELQAYKDLLLMEGCIDAFICYGGLVEAYFHMESRSACKKLPGKRSYIPAPHYVPGELVRLLRHFPGAIQYSPARVTHISCDHQSCNRYQVICIETQAVGWVDPEWLEPLETAPIAQPEQEGRDEEDEP